VFDAAWNETVQGALVEGASFAIDYDPARLPTCRASHNGNPGWNITASARFLPSGAQADASIMAHAPSPSGAPDYYSWIKTVPVMAIPAGTTQIELWFNNTSAFDNPCTAYDSDFGKNYRFSVGPARPKATLSFQQDWRNVAAGKLTRGGEVTVDYDTSRLENQLAPYGGPGSVCREVISNLQLNVRFSPSAPFQIVPLANVSQRGPLVGITSTTVAIPADATRFEAFFAGELGYAAWDCSSPPPPPAPNGVPAPAPIKTTSSSRYYDSNFGRNFVFSIP
jgi:hypothetical protein